MVIHNLVEDAVLQIINDICDEEEAAGNPHNYSTSRLSRLDAVCYVLNRVQPRYVTSARGVAHVETDFSGHPQTRIDLVTMAHEALRRVSFVQRYYAGNDTDTTPDPATQSEPHFNFPTIKGRLFHGNTFEPMAGIEVHLRRDSQPVAMFDPRWQNPFVLGDNTYGTYLFWPGSLPAQAGAERSFEFEISAAVDGFDPLHHYFTLTLQADPTRAEVFRFDREYVVPDLYLFPADNDPDDTL